MDIVEYLKVILVLFIVTGCEPDDICLSSYPDTPNLIIKFVDYNSGDRKSVNKLRIKGSNLNEVFYTGTTDSIAIPLNNYKNTSSFSFMNNFDESNENEDLIYFDYQRNNIYISKACGYIMEYKLNNIVVESDNSNWIVSSEIHTSLINNEISHHVKVYH